MGPEIPEATTLTKKIRTRSVRLAYSQEPDLRPPARNTTFLVRRTTARLPKNMDDSKIAGVKSNRIQRETAIDDSAISESAIVTIVPRSFVTFNFIQMLAVFRGYLPKSSRTTCYRAATESHAIRVFSREEEGPLVN